MTHVASIVICLAAFAALGFATDRVQADLLGRELPARTRHGLQAAGWALLVASLAVVVDGQGWGLGLVSYSGHTSFAAGVVYLALIAGQRYRQGYRQRNAQRAPGASRTSSRPRTNSST